ncbi:MAG TPA: hypothetical protein PLD84_11250, partial [Chitinophagales bacterium]|nr:hypothetical protein [Chitinophagales bacterium]
MKKIYLLLFTLVSSPSAFSQQYEWATANTLNYNLNPSYPVNIVCANDNGTVFTSHTDSSVLIYGVDIFGKTGIDCYNALGALQWSISLGNKVVV